MSYTCLKCEEDISEIVDKIIESSEALDFVICPKCETKMHIWIDEDFNGDGEFEGISYKLNLE